MTLASASGRGNLTGDSNPLHLHAEFFQDAVPSLRADEPELVRGVLRMLQGFPTSLFHWDDQQRGFFLEDGVHASHLSRAALHNLLTRFVFSSDCLKLVEIFVKRVEALREAPPTLRAFSGCVSSWLAVLRREVLKEEEERARSSTLTGLSDSLSSICARAEYLLYIVQGSVPGAFFDCQSSISSAELAVHILDHLFLKLNEVCLVQGGEEDAYRMLVTILTGSLLPYLEELDSWFCDGTLDDPYEELFFYANKLISVDQPEFWEKSYLLRIGARKRCSQNDFVAQSFHGSAIQDDNSEKPPAVHSSSKRTDRNDNDTILCPLFLKGVAKAIISAGKSLQLVRHVWCDSSSVFTKGSVCNVNLSTTFPYPDLADSHNMTCRTNLHIKYTNYEESKLDDDTDMPAKENNELMSCQDLRILNIPEIFLISLVGLIGDGTHIHEFFPYAYTSFQEILKAYKGYMDNQKIDEENNEKLHTRVWLDLMVDIIIKQRRCLGMDTLSLRSTAACKASFVPTEEVLDTTFGFMQNRLLNDGSERNSKFIPLFSPENPVMTVCKDLLLENAALWHGLNLSCNFHLPPLNDETLREAIFGEEIDNANNNSDNLSECLMPLPEGTDFSLGYKSHQFGEFQSHKGLDSLETLYPFPTLLPHLQENLPVSEFIPFQKNGTLATRVLNWLQGNKTSAAPLPSVIIQECLMVYVHRQVNFIGSRILMKLMNEWKLMDELNILRSIYLLGSGDLLQQFLIVIFDKVDKGDTLDDEFELNTILQESIRNSVDGNIIGPPESLSVSIPKHDISDAKNHSTNIPCTKKLSKCAYGIDALDVMKFTYKVSWPLDLIINKEGIKKYNQVLNFLLKVKRAKFVLDKARRWIWKFRGPVTCSRKHHLLVEQKLLHFVDAFHQYVMDKVLHSSWLEICNGMISAGSLDEVIDVHEAYLLSIQRQCFVASDKLWILIASRVKVVLGLALDFYTIQKTLSSGGAAPAIKTRCEMEVDRIEKEFDECIAFLLRVMSFKLNVGHFPHLADLVTRINYNYFYMSSDGSLLTTIPSFESSGAKLVKTSFLG